MKMRKILAVLTAVLMLCSIIPMGAMVSAADAVYSADFEDGTLGTWASSSGGSAELVAAADLPVANPNGGNYAIKTVIESDKYPYLSDQTGFALEANTDYVIKVDVLHATNNWPVEVIIGGNYWLSSSSRVFATGQVNVGNTAWTTLTFIFNSGSATKGYMGVKSNWANCTVYFDNISVAKADVSSVGTSDGYIYNGDFETGATDPWSIGNNVEVVSDPTGSDRGYVMKADEAGSGAALFSQVANNLKANTYYKLSFKVYNYNTATNNAFWVRFPSSVTDWSVDLSAASGMSSQTVNAYTPRINVLGKTGAWYDLSITFNTGDLTSVLISFLNYRSGAGQYYFDNIKIREVQDPSFDGYITNGNFETGDLTGWTNTSAAVVEENGTFYLQGTNTSKYGNFVHQIVTVEANAEYAISFKAKAAVSGGQARLYAGTGTGNTGYKNTTYYWAPSTDAWTTYTTTFNSGDNTELYINLCQGINNGGDIYYDDVLMWKVQDPSFDGTLYNGDFETGTTTGWSKHQSTTVDAESAYEGTFGAHLQGASAGWGGVLNQTVTLVSGANYNITFWYKAIQQGINFKLSGDNTGTKYASKYMDINEWTQVSADFTADDTSATLNFSCSGIGESSSNYVAGIDELYVDSIVITLLPCDACSSFDNDCDTTCNICGTVREVTHSYAGEETQAPTCTEAGVMTYTCSVCGDSYTEEIPAAHTYTDNCDMDCDVCGEYRDAPHNLTTHVEEVVPANCQEEGNPEYWICEDCGGYFQANSAGGYNQTNPAWLFYTGEHVRPEGVAACAVVACELCGEDSYGSESCVRPEGDPVCQDSTCVNCGATVYGWGCNYNTGDEETPLPLCQAGTCVYCGTEYEYLYECENGAWAACQDGECSYGCGKQYPATANHTLEDCTVDGNCSVCWSYIEAGEHTYAYDCSAECSVCANGAREAEHSYFYPCDPVCQICYEITNPDATHNIVAVEAVEATCTVNGNIAYWYCSDCGAAWADEALTQMTNRFNVIVPATGEHTYDNDFDADCNVCGGIREVDCPIAYVGKSVSEDCSGYAVLFNAEVDGIVVKAGTFVQADYTNATYNGYKLLGLGVEASNGVSETTIEGIRMYDLEDGNAKFAFRITNIPADKLDVEITMTPYYVIEIDGVETTIYGEAQVGSYAEVAG